MNIPSTSRKLSGHTWGEQLPDVGGNAHIHRALHVARRRFDEALIEEALLDIEQPEEVIDQEEAWLEYHFGGMDGRGVDPAAGYWEDVKDSQIQGSQFGSLEGAQQWALEFVSAQADSSRSALDRMEGRGDKYDSEEELYYTLCDIERELKHTYQHASWADWLVA